jgi:Kunitz/Bovine pancreatic trypsin inhibitor domain
MLNIQCATETLRKHSCLAMIMHQATSLLPRITLFILLLTSAATPTWAATCLFYTTKAACTRYTDSGSCLWNAQAEVCLDGGPSLPPGTVGVAIVGLDPGTAPLELKPGPSVSFGNVSLVNGSEINVKFQDQKALSLNAASSEGGEETPLDENTKPEEVLKVHEAPTAEINDIFCFMPPVMGRCRGFFSRWYWDSEAGRCEEFTYGGCGGNENNFTSKEECEVAAQNYC